MKYMAALCLECGEVLVSTKEKPFEQCKCKNESFIDGNSTHCRYGGQDLHMVITGTWDVREQSFEADSIYKGVLGESANMSGKRTTH